MVVVRGNNIFPASLEAIIRRFEGVAEFRVQVVDDVSLARLRVDVEPANGADSAQLTRQVAQAIQDALNFRADVHAVAAGSLPRFDMKARRFIRMTRRT
jgi:phenylacetate-CoA ligase